MGLRFRKRTKGKNAWLNFSYSEKNGFNISASGKVGPFTLNSGNGKSTRSRVTTNLPGGFYHVTSSKKSKLPRPSNEYTPTVHSEGSGDAIKVWAVIMGIIVVAGCIYNPSLIPTVAFWGFVVWGIVKLTK